MGESMKVIGKMESNMELAYTLQLLVKQRKESGAKVKEWHGSAEEFEKPYIIEIYNEFVSNKLLTTIPIYITNY
jgi:hypothetical protein